MIDSESKNWKTYKYIFGKYFLDDDLDDQWIWQSRYPLNIIFLLTTKLSYNISVLYLESMVQENPRKAGRKREEIKPWG